MPYNIPNNEDERLRILNGLALLDTHPEQVFDDICRSAASEFNCSVALITLVASGRQWFKAAHGWNVCETSREHSFCNHIVVDDGVLLVPDASQDPRFATNPLVIGPPFVRFYAGAPLYYGENIRLGALCIIDQNPKSAYDVDVERLSKLADRVAGEIWIRNCNKN